MKDLAAQAVLHDDGAIVASTGRHTFVYARAGRSLSLHVEPLNVYYVRLPDEPRWDDGTPLTTDEVQQMAADVTATFTRWGEVCEIIAADDPRILRSLDQLVDYIRSEAIGAGT